MQCHYEWANRKGHSKQLHFAQNNHICHYWKKYYSTNETFIILPSITKECINYIISAFEYQIFHMACTSVIWPWCAGPLWPQSKLYHLNKRKAWIGRLWKLHQNLDITLKCGCFGQNVVVLGVPYYHKFNRTPNLQSPTSNLQLGSFYKGQGLFLLGFLYTQNPPPNSNLQQKYEGQSLGCGATPIGQIERDTQNNYILPKTTTFVTIKKEYYPMD